MTFDIVGCWTGGVCASDDKSIMILVGVSKKIRLMIDRFALMMICANQQSSSSSIRDVIGDKGEKVGVKAIVFSLRTISHSSAN